jgi:lipopolysaccharide/colanic/teichoic acid biosynthesis glycosyltransferase
MATRLRPAAYAATKRALDMLIAASALIMLLPLFALVAVAIVLESGWPVFYWSKRVGKGGAPFLMLKFRSMRTGCDEGAHAAFVRGLLREGTSCTFYKPPQDPRITRFGAFLRRTSIDELPQLWNVVRGEMSLVGPRPDPPYAFAEYSDWIHPRLSVKPGMTGLWQVSGRSRLSPHDMYRLDLAYVARASLALDVWILARTIPAVLAHDGAA